MTFSELYQQVVNYSDREKINIARNSFATIANFFEDGEKFAAFIVNLTAVFAGAASPGSDTDVFLADVSGLSFAADLVPASAGFLDCNGCAFLQRSDNLAVRACAFPDIQGSSRYLAGLCQCQDGNQA